MNITKDDKNQTRHLFWAFEIYSELVRKENVIDLCFTDLIEHISKYKYCAHHDITSKPN